MLISNANRFYRTRRSISKECLLYLEQYENTDNTPHENTHHEEMVMIKERTPYNIHYRKIVTNDITPYKFKHLTNIRIIRNDI